MKLSDCYQILGLKASATPQDVHRAYKRLALRFHPDRTGGSPKHEAIFRHVTEAYTQLRRYMHGEGSERIGICARCTTVADIFEGLDGRRYCADCLLKAHRRVLPMPTMEQIRCVLAMLCQAAAVVLLVMLWRAGEAHYGLFAGALTLASMGMLFWNVLSADRIDTT